MRRHSINALQYTDSEEAFWGNDTLQKIQPVGEERVAIQVLNISSEVARQLEPTIVEICASAETPEQAIERVDAAVLKKFNNDTAAAFVTRKPTIVLNGSCKDALTEKADNYRSRVVPEEQHRRNAHMLYGAFIIDALVEEGEVSAEDLKRKLRSIYTESFEEDSFNYAFLLVAEKYNV